MSKSESIVESLTEPAVFLVCVLAGSVDAGRVRCGGRRTSAEAAPAFCTVASPPFSDRFDVVFRLRTAGSDMAVSTVQGGCRALGRVQRGGGWTCEGEVGTSSGYTWHESPRIRSRGNIAVKAGN